jgi:hypothetical protein
LGGFAFSIKGLFGIVGSAAKVAGPGKSLITLATPLSGLTGSTYAKRLQAADDAWASSDARDSATQSWR